MLGLEEFGFGENDENISADNSKFTASKGQTYLASFAWWPSKEDGTPNLDHPTPRFVGGTQLWIEGVGKVIDQGPEYQALAKQPGRPYIATLIVLWPIDVAPNGAPELDLNKLSKGRGIEIRPWRITKSRYNEIKQRQARKPLGHHDISISCGIKDTDEKYQNLTLELVPDCTLRKVLESQKPEMQSISKRIMSKIKELEGIVSEEIGKVYTIDELHEKLREKGYDYSVGSYTTDSNAIDDEMNILDGL